MCSPPIVATIREIRPLPMARNRRPARLWHRLLGRLRPAPITTVAALRSFLDERAALIAQKCAIDYCRGKTGLASYALFTEQPFLKALDVCRWEAFAAVLGDLVLLAEGRLRPHVASEEHPRLCAALIDLHSTILDALPVPEHRPQGWGDAREAFAAPLKSASAGKPQQALD